MIKASIPMPVQIVLDDVGWWCGQDDHERNGPYRTGAPRNHVPADYAAVVALGKRLGMKPQAAMILGEWDKENILARIPTATWMGAQWDNKKWVGPWLDEAAQIIRDGKAHFEIVFHGLGHEYWGPDGKFTRAEFHDEQRAMRPLDQVKLHIEAYARILKQHKLGPFPQAYAPTAGHYAFGKGEQDLAAVFRSVGIKYVATPFTHMKAHQLTQTPRLGVECEVVVIDRGPDHMPWPAIDCHPNSPIPGPILGLHWPNILHPDPARNLEVVDRWVEFLKPYGHTLNRTLAPDTPSCWTQYAFNQCATVNVSESSIGIDMRAMDRLPKSHLGRSFTLKIDAPAHFKFTTRDAILESAAFDDEGKHHVLKLQRMDSTMVVIRWQAGSA